MAYQAVGYAPNAGWSTADYQAYYSSYGSYPGYDYSAYYQQQYAGQPAGAAGAQGAKPAEPASADGPGFSASSGPPPPPPPASVAPPAPPGSPPPPPAGEPAAGANSEKPPGVDAPPVPPQSQPGAQVSAAAAAGAQAPTAAGAGAEGYDAAYAQWYAQTYGYGYGYDAQQYAYWNQQQGGQGGQADPYAAYGYSAQQAQQAQQQQRPGPTPPKGPPPSSAGLSSTPKPFSSMQDSPYNAQPPPSNLYTNQQQRRVGLTGSNMVPMGPRPPPGDPPPSASDGSQAAGRSKGPTVIRPQLPAGRASASTPAYIPVGAPSSTTPAFKNPSVSAAVAEAAAAAAAAAAKAKAAQAQQGAGQWPPSFSSWVTRCFNAARLRNIPDGKLSEKLMAYLDLVKTEGRLWTTDWDTHPVLLPDGSTVGGSAGGDQALSPSGPQARKRSRWGTAPAPLQERTQDADTDEEDRGWQQHGRRQGGRSSNPTSPRDQLYQQPMSNRKRRKLLALEARQAGRAGGGGFGVEDARRQARAGRFANGRANGAVRGGGNYSDDSDMVMDDEDDEEAAARRFGGIVVGTSQALEKSYFRLTSQPDPGTVRPEPVLERALARLVAMIARSEATYFYALDQFKGMRQDCTVQHLRNGLAVRVYEAHARSSLEYGDAAEFNQCQTRLGHLYAEGQPGCVAEFTAYRLMYETAHVASSGRQAGSTMARSLLHTMRNVPKEMAGLPEIRHALQVREAVMTLNYAAFFRLYATAPHMGRAIMDIIAENMRWAGLNAFVKACDLPVPVAALAAILGFTPRPIGPATPDRGGEAQGAGAEGKAGAGKAPLPGCQAAFLEGDTAPAATEAEGEEACAQWLRDHGAVVVDKGSELQLDAKASRGKLFIPEVPAKVAHGDENLSLTDFLSRAQRTLDG